jgi:hypothetical protein
LLVLLALVTAAFTVFVAASAAVLTGSPSNFESGNDPSLGVGNMIVNTTGNNDWASVNFTHLSDAAASNSDDSFEPGSKQDTVCPVVEGHKNPPKDDFTDIASYTEVNSTSGATYLYGATIRYTANGNASENIELKQGTAGLCPGSTVLLARVAGDKMIAIDYLGGGSAVQFHVLTWVTSGACNVSNHTAPCWGATVTTLPANVAEGGVSTSNISAADNPISDVAIVAGQFAEFGINLAGAGIIPAGSCKSFSQTVWESRSSGSSFVSSTKDITIEDQDINNCASVSVIKLGSDGGSQAGAVFTLYEGTGTGGTVVGSCTVLADGSCSDDSFSDLSPGTYTIDETSTPAGYDPDPSLPFTFTLATGENRVLTFTDPAQAGALAILKNSTKGGAVSQGGAIFSYDGGSVTDNGAGDEDSAIGSVCVSGLAPGGYTVNETSPPPGYGDASEGGQSVTVQNGTDCSGSLPGAGATATFTNPPLADLLVRVDGQESGEISSTIDCGSAGSAGPGDPAVLDVDDLEPQTINCEIVIDP